MAEKKRKRHDQGAERPSKKAAIAPASGNVRLDFVDNKDGLGPVLASTPGLNFPSRITFKPYTCSKIDPDPRERTELLLQSSQHARLDYSAREEKDGSSDSLLRDYIGVFDPSTGKLQVVEVKKVTVRSTLRSEVDELREENARIAAERDTMTARRHELASEFGSKKSRKAIQNLTENAISRGQAGGDTDAAKNKNEDVASTVLQGMSNITAAMPTKADLAATVNASKPRPHANLAAEYVADVYTIDTIVGKELLGLIPVKDWVEASEKAKGVQVASKFVARRISKLCKNSELQKLKVLRFMLLCINFNNALQKKGKGPMSVPVKNKLVPLMGEHAPGPVIDAIRRRFASENNELTRWHIDNLMTHIAAAALIVDNFEVDVNDLREDLKLENKEIKQYFTELGCRVTQPTETDRTRLKISKAEGVNHWLAKLKLPLVFPKVRTGLSKKR